MNYINNSQTLNFESSAQKLSTKKESKIWKVVALVLLFIIGMMAGSQSNGISHNAGLMRSQTHKQYNDNDYCPNCGPRNGHYE